MKAGGRGWWTAVAAASALLIAGGVLLLARDDEPETPDPAPVATPIPVEPDGGIGDGAGPPRRARGADGTGRDGGEGRSGPDPEAFALRQAERAYRSYLDAINARDGRALCERLIRPGFERELKPPKERGSCAASIEASIGYADPRGFPVWEATALSAVESAELTGDLGVTINASIVTRFRDRDQPSVESDIAYLEARDGRYRLVKPSGALWRAVGKPDVPFEAIAEPPGF